MWVVGRLCYLSWIVRFITWCLWFVLLLVGLFWGGLCLGWVLVWDGCSLGCGFVYACRLFTLTYRRCIYYLVLVVWLLDCFWCGLFGFWVWVVLLF